jgi:hypothetical protein
MGLFFPERSISELCPAKGLCGTYPRCHLNLSQTLAGQFKEGIGSQKRFGWGVLYRPTRAETKPQTAPPRHESLGHPCKPPTTCSRDSFTRLSPPFVQDTTCTLRFCAYINHAVPKTHLSSQCFVRGCNCPKLCTTNLFQWFWMHFISGSYTNC